MNTEKAKIVLVGSDRQLMVSIARLLSTYLRIEYNEEKETDLIILGSADEAIEAAKKLKKCIIITESVVQQFVPTGINTDGAERIAKETAHMGNCRVILYTGQPYDMDTSLFDSHVTMGKHGDMETLLEEIYKYCPAYEPQKIILVHCAIPNFVGVADRLETARGSDKNIFHVASLEDMVEVLPTTGNCIVITDSVVIYNNAKTLKDGAKKLLAQAKQKNPECKVVLYTIDAFNLKTESFDDFIDARVIENYDALFKKIEEYSN